MHSHMRAFLVRPVDSIVWSILVAGSDTAFPGLGCNGEHFWQGNWRTLSANWRTSWRDRAPNAAPVPQVRPALHSSTLAACRRTLFAWSRSMLRAWSCTIAWYAWRSAGLTWPWLMTGAQIATRDHACNQTLPNVLVWEGGRGSDDVFACALCYAPAAWAALLPCLGEGRGGGRLPVPGRPVLSLLTEVAWRVNALPNAVLSGIGESAVERLESQDGPCEVHGYSRHLQAADVADWHLNLPACGNLSWHLCSACWLGRGPRECWASLVPPGSLCCWFSRFV